MKAIALLEPRDLRSPLHTSSSLPHSSNMSFLFRQGSRAATTAETVVLSTGQQVPQQQQQQPQPQGSKRSRTGEVTASTIIAPKYPAFLPLSLVPPASGDMALLPMLQSIVTRHLAAVEVQCSAAGVVQGGTFLEATRAATTALLDSAKQMGASGDSGSGIGSGSGSGSGSGAGAGGGNPKNAANRTRLAVLKRQTTSYQTEVSQWKGLLTKHKVGGKREEEGEGEGEEEGEEDEELDADLLKAHLGGGEGGSAADSSMALSTLIDLDDIARGVRAVARRMDAMQKGVEGASKELHGAAAASAGLMGSGADPKALLRGLAAGGGGEDFKSPRRLLKDLAGRGGGGATPSSLKRSMRITPGK